MKAVWTICKKEYRSFFTTPVGYVFIIFFMMITNGIFFILNQFFTAGQVSMRSYFAILPWIFLFFIPSFTMGSWSEEKSQGTLEVLLTQPLSEWQAVLGKYLAGLLFLITALAGTLTVPFTLGRIGDPDGGAIFASYVGTILLGSAYLAVGAFLSCLSRNQVVAFIITVSVLFVLIIIGNPSTIQMGAEFFAGSAWFSRVVHLLSYLSLVTHYTNIAKGVLDTRDILYYLLVTAFFLMLTAKTIELRKWR